MSKTKSSTTFSATATKLKQKAMVTKEEGLRLHVNHAINSDGDVGSIKMSNENHEVSEEDEDGAKMSQDIASSQWKDNLPFS